MHREWAWRALQAGYSMGVVTEPLTYAVFAYNTTDRTHQGKGREQWNSKDNEIAQVIHRWDSPWLTLTSQWGVNNSDVHLLPLTRTHMRNLTLNGIMST